MCYLWGWCRLGVFLLLAFICIRHECQDLSSLCNGMHVCTDKTSVYTLIQKNLERMESEQSLTPREKTSTGNSEEDQTHDPASCRTACPTHYPSFVKFHIFLSKGIP